MSPEEESDLTFVPPTVEELSALIPSYTVQRLVAVGGMGAVYQGVQRGLERPVAIKILPLEAADDEDAIERFRNEAIAMARLVHPHIPAVYDFDVAQGTCYFVMEFVEGSNGWQLIHENNLPPDEAIRILAQVCDAVAYAHGKGVIHGDLKPSNILLTADREVKLADFGLARLVGSGDRDADDWEPMGTPEYAAPELFDRSVTSDHRADIYSIGVLLYEMLTGNPPQGEFELPAAPLRLDPRLDDIIAKCMAVDPDARYASASEIHQILRAVEAAPQLASTTPAVRIHRPVTSRSPQAPRRAGPSHVIRPPRVPGPGIVRPPRPSPARAPRKKERSATPVIMGSIIGVIVLLVLLTLLKK